jgi:hypothetical protein
VKSTSAKLIGGAYQNVPLTVIARPISAAHPMAGLIRPRALPTLFGRHFSIVATFSD